MFNHNSAPHPTPPCPSSTSAGSELMIPGINSRCPCSQHQRLFSVKGRYQPLNSPVNGQTSAIYSFPFRVNAKKHPATPHSVNSRRTPLIVGGARFSSIIVAWKSGGTRIRYSASKEGLKSAATQSVGSLELLEFVNEFDGMKAWQKAALHLSTIRGRPRGDFRKGGQRTQEGVIG